MEQCIFAAGAFELPKKNTKPRFKISSSIRLFQARKIIIHEKYGEGGPFDYDFALVRVGKAWKTKAQNGESYLDPMDPEDDEYFDGELPFSAYLRPVCLPCSGFVTKEMLKDAKGNSLVNDNMNEEDLCRVEGEWLLGRHAPENTTKIWVTGFGIKKTGGDTPNMLQRTTLKIESREKCDYDVERMRVAPDNGEVEAAVSTDQMFCTGYTGIKYTDVCKGDSGGPLVRKVKNADEEERIIQVGVVSWGVDCGKTDTLGKYYPGFQADVTKVIPWIRQHKEEDKEKEEEDEVVGED